MPKEDPETTALKKELTDLIEQVKADQEKLADCKLVEKCSDLGSIPKIRLQVKKSLKGHINKRHEGTGHTAAIRMACGGMDNMCTIYDVNNRDSTGAAKMVRELAGYEGFLSSCRCVWDLEAGKREMEFDAHAGDVVTISLSPDMKTYVTGSVDKTCKLWDVRDEKAKQTFFGHEADVNSVWTLNGHENRVTSIAVSPNGVAMTSCSWDQGVKVWG
ncbi:Guanine nucleotide-binding protein beta 2 [Operophtera brumata]|uniref:Guanine nucleotide-binding protein beta 2 n=1 Tax=Operophtera brumata TaxID=104452 RepID=A0A0L7LCS0_OPEBR|nr:Guanine nucleotide-binding protein beta 2 [Operophtera brumata]